MQRAMRVIGTAGHVDHGKSTLVKALTGTHPDRLKEEREREMTIDLGFAWMTLPLDDQPGTEEVGIVDVPGHRDFIENMLAGVGGIDAALFVIAADEGVMPQTREHLAILDLLKIESGVIALTKTDVVDQKDLGGEDWLDLIESDIRSIVSGTVLEDAQIVRVSGVSGAGIPELKRAIAGVLAKQPARPDILRPRLPVDRVFSMPGFGTVVTGTLMDGSLSIGDEIEILPSKISTRIRGLQSHKQREDTAVPGSRTAVNITGVAVENIRRGDVLAHPSTYKPTRRLDALVKLLPDASIPLKHNQELKFYIAASDVVARTRLLGTDEIKPGTEGWVQFELKEPVVAVKGDRFIIRRPSPGETLGGGLVIDPHPRRRYRRFSDSNIARLDALAKGDPEQVVLETLETLSTASLTQLINSAHMDTGEVKKLVSGLVKQGEIVILGGNEPGVKNALLLTAASWQWVSGKILNQVADYHERFPLKMGIPPQELRTKLKEPVLANLAIDQLIQEEKLVERGAVLRLPGHRIIFTPDQESAASRLLKRFEAAPNAPPSVKECIAEVGPDIYAALVELGRLVPVSQEVVFREQDYTRLVDETREYLKTNGTITVAQARDRFNTSRKYILALFEHFDAIGITKRVGDERRLK